MENQGERWRDRLESQGWKAESLILLARISAEMVDHAASGGLAPAGERMLAEQTIPIDWVKAYCAAPKFLTRMVSILIPVSPRWRFRMISSWELGCELS